MRGSKAKPAAGHFGAQCVAAAHAGGQRGKVQRLHRKVVRKAAPHILAENDPDAPGPHDAVGHHGGDQRAGDVKSGKEQKAQRQIHRCGRDHKPLVILKMAEDGAVAAEHPVVPATYSFRQNTSTKPRGSSHCSPIQDAMNGWNRQK